MDRRLPRFLVRLTKILLGAAVIGAVLLCLWWRGAFLPGWIQWKEGVRETLPEELEERLKSSWLVQDALSLDLTGDGNNEKILLVWKHGSYGSHRPTWVKRNDIGFSQHIFIYERRDDEYHPIWMSSALEFQVASFSPGGEIPGTKGRESLLLSAPDGTESRWGWLSWGLKRIGR